MRNSGSKFRKVGMFDTQLWVDEWRRVHPIKPAALVAQNLGAPVRSVEKWFSGEASPSLKWIGPIFTMYGATFVLRGMRNPPAWLCEASRREQRERVAILQNAIDAEFSDLEYAECEA